MNGPLDFQIWHTASHFLTILFISLLVRSGLEILSACPRLYLNDHCRPGNEALTLSRRRLPTAGLWTSTDMEEKWPAWLALPGGSRLGLGRHWHFASVIGWILTGVVYVTLLFAADEWRRLVPTSWGIVPQAVSDLGTYLTFAVPAETGGYNALQQLTYFAIVFIVAPLQIATGAAMSPAIDARFPRAVRLLGGRQRARTLHFALLVVFCGFIAVHSLMVVVHGLGSGLARIVLGSAAHSHALAIGVAALGLAAVIVVNVLATVASVRAPRATRRATGALVGPPERLMSRALRPSRRPLGVPVSSYHWINGRPPADDAYRRMREGAFRDWRLTLTGMVEQPLELDLDQLRALPARSDRSLHHCIQGWSSVGDWRGVPLVEVLALCRPLPGARFAVFWAMDDKAETDHQGDGHYFEAIHLEVLEAGDALLAYEMNGAPLPPEHGAPLRLRLDNQLGFKMVKWLCRIELVAQIDTLGVGGGGWREDHLQFENAVAI